MDQEYVRLTKNILDIQDNIKKFENAKSTYLEYLGIQSVAEEENGQIPE